MTYDVQFSCSTIRCLENWTKAVRACEYPRERVKDWGSLARGQKATYARWSWCARRCSETPLGDFKKAWRYEMEPLGTCVPRNKDKEKERERGRVTSRTWNAQQGGKVRRSSIQANSASASPTPDEPVSHTTVEKYLIEEREHVHISWFPSYYTILTCAHPHTP